MKVVIIAIIASNCMQPFVLCSWSNYAVICNTWFEYETVPHWILLLIVHPEMKIHICTVEIRHGEHWEWSKTTEESCNCLFTKGSTITMKPLQHPDDAQSKHFVAIQKHGWSKRPKTHFLLSIFDVTQEKNILIMSA